MTKEFVGEIVASSKPGMPLDFLAKFKGKGDAAKVLTNISNEIEMRLRSKGYSSTRYTVVGMFYPSSERIEIFSGAKKGTRTHEETHKWLRRIWKDPDDIFNESNAYAWADFVHNKNFVERRRNFSLRARKFYDDSLGKFETGRIDRDYFDTMNDLLTKAHIGFTEKSWAAFLNACECLGYYAFFADLIERIGPSKADAVVKEAAVIARDHGLEHGMDALMFNAGYWPTDEVYRDFEPFPDLWHPDFDNTPRGVSVFGDDDGDRLEVKVWSCHDRGLIESAKVLSLTQRALRITAGRVDQSFKPGIMNQAMEELPYEHY